MSAKPTPDTHSYCAIKARFIADEDGELQEITDAMNSGDYHGALEVAKRITVLMNKLTKGHIRQVVL